MPADSSDLAVLVAIAGIFTLLIGVLLVVAVIRFVRGIRRSSQRLRNVDTRLSRIEARLVASDPNQQSSGKASSAAPHPGNGQAGQSPD